MDFSIILLFCFFRNSFHSCTPSRSHLESDLGAISVPYDPKKKWDGRTSFFGASLTAFVELLAPYGLVLYYCESHGVNAFFVNKRFVEEEPGGDVDMLWRKPNFYGRGWRYPTLHWKKPVRNG